LYVAEAIALAWRGLSNTLQRRARFKLLLENTAGAGAQLGGKLEELATIRHVTSPYVDVPIGYCLDTCHCYVAGWDMATAPGLAAFIADAKNTLGLAHVPVMHANDAKMKLASHCDRHANIGAGYIGLEGFRRILNHPELREKAFILETPVDEPGDDQRNVNALKELVSQNEPTTTRRSKKSGTAGGRRTTRST
jgi:deoxyribonuclease IV